LSYFLSIAKFCKYLQFMELRQLKYFVTVAEELQFSSASRKLLVSQPALSQQIKLLETELGVDLFIKVQRQIYRKVVLTQEGEAFLKDAQKIVQLCDKAKNNVRSRVFSKKTLKLGTYRMLIGQRILDTLALFSKHFPDLDIEILELPTFLNVQEALLDETIDFGISILPLHYKELDYIVLKKSELSLILPHHHFLAQQEKITLEQLSQERWIEITASFHPIFEEVEKLCIRAGFNRRPNIVQEVSSLEIMAQLVAMGKGIAFVPSFFDTSSIPNIVNIPLDNIAIIFEQCLVFRSDRYKDMQHVLMPSPFL
jgi:DNA-binding transcriptional LysR family regulator